MHLIITDARKARSIAIQITFLRLTAVAVFFCALIGFGLVACTFVYQTLVETSPNDHQNSFEKDRYVRVNLDVMAQRLGEMQVKVMRLESMNERIKGFAGISNPTPKIPSSFSHDDGKSGILVLQKPQSIENIEMALDDFERLTDKNNDLMIVLKSRLLDQHFLNKMMRAQSPVANQNVASHFGWRLDPMTGQSALHTGLNFQES